MERSLTMTSSFTDKIADLEARVADIKLLGGEAAIAKQHAAGKLNCRERLDLLIDVKDGESTFSEIMLHAHHQSESAMMQGRKTPADGVICEVNLQHSIFP
jgi:propionyl-CoA carboxylase beta chain